MPCEEIARAQERGEDDSSCCHVPSVVLYGLVRTDANSAACPTTRSKATTRCRIWIA